MKVEFKNFAPRIHGDIFETVRILRKEDNYDKVTVIYNNEQVAVDEDEEKVLLPCKHITVFTSQKDSLTKNVAFATKMAGAYGCHATVTTEGATIEINILEAQIATLDKQHLENYVAVQCDAYKKTLKL